MDHSQPPKGKGNLGMSWVRFCESLSMGSRHTAFWKHPETRKGGSRWGLSGLSLAGHPLGIPRSCDQITSPLYLAYSGPPQVADLT